eukprot:Gb_27157 [translate_table: standard]
MADHQRVHPANEDLERNVSPSAPLAPQFSLQSEKGDPGLGGNIPVKRQVAEVPIDKAPAPQAPRYYSRPPKRRNCCCRCLAWTFCLLFTLILIVAIVGVIFYLVFQPRIPKYSVEDIQITGFNIDPSDTSVDSQFDVTVRARNPNKKIGIYYLKHSHLKVYYEDTKLCSGSLPVFYQGHKNTTILQVNLTGNNVVITSDHYSRLQTQIQEGSIPLVLKGDVPVKIKVGRLKLMKITFRFRCKLTVDNLTPNGNVRITSKSCKFRL